MTVKEIIKKYLNDNDFDGLASGHCGCDMDDLFVCNENFSECEPAYKISNPTKDACL